MTRAGRLLITGTNDARSAESITGGTSDGAQEGGQVWNGGDAASGQNKGADLIAGKGSGNCDQAVPDQASKREVEEEVR